MPSTINLDLDGVVYPFHVAVTRMMQEWLAYYAPKEWRQAGLVDLPLPTTWLFWEEWGLPAEVYFELFWPWAVEHGVFNQTVAPIPGAREGISQLREWGFEIRIVTHKPVHNGDGFKHHAIRDAVQWLSWNHIEYDSIVFDGNKGRYHAMYAIDDKPSRDWMQFPGRNILFAQPWNEDFEDPNILLRAGSWSEVVAHINRTRVARAAYLQSLESQLDKLPATLP